MKKRIFYAALAALLILPAVSMAEETETDKIKTLGEVVITATRVAKETNKVPANVTVITAEEIADSGASDIVEVLEKQANILFVSYSGNITEAKLDLRGFGENGYGKTLVLLDGRRLNRPDLAGVNWTQLPLEKIERIEVVRGSGSVLYGDAAVAGVINIITKKGAIEPSLTGSVQIGEDEFYRESAGIIGSSERLSYAINVSNQQTDGWRDRTGFHSYGGGFQLGYDVSESLGISGGASFSRTDYELSGSLTEAQIDEDRTQADYPDHESENDYRNFNFLIEASHGNLGDFEINLVYGTIESENDRPTEWKSYSRAEFSSFGVQPKYIWSYNSGNYMNELVTGVDYYHDKMDINSFDYNDALTSLSKKVYAELEKDTIGWYIRDELTFNNNLVLSGGGRIEKSNIKVGLTDFKDSGYNYDEDKDHNGKVFELGITWLPKESVKTYAKFSKVYRYPFTDEQASYFGSTPWGGDSFNPDLEAEKGKSYEAGLELTHSNDISFGLTLFRIDMEDEISWNGSMNDNLDETRHRGLESFLNYNLRGVLDLQLNYTYQEATFEKGANKGNDIPLVPNHLISAILDLALPYDIHLIPSVQYVSDSYLSGDNDNNTEKLDGYTVADLLLRYKSSIGDVKVTLFLGVSNIFDKEFSTFGLDLDQYDWPPFYDYDNVFYPAPGRKFFGGISGTF